MGKAATISPLAPARFPDLPAIDGVRLATAEAGIRYKDRTDVLFVGLDAGTVAAGVFTRSKCPSAPVDWCRAALATGEARALVVNSGNANAFTGAKGRSAVEHTAALAAGALGAKENAIFLASTGVIGEPLDATKFEPVMAGLVKEAKEGGFEAAARAIMTTDTFPKGATATVPLPGGPVHIVGIAKGAGMIAPDMATMLSFIFTDAPIAQPLLQKLLARGVADSFNAVTVDSDTSTSDTLMLFATGAAARRGVARIEPGTKAARMFAAALDGVLLDLAKQVARDGEGARKFVTVEVRGAVSKASARRVAMSIANSPLVKTAIAGEDANWGRIVMAVGKAGEPAERDRLSIAFGDIRVAYKGARDPAYDEAATTAYMRGQEIEVRVDLDMGKASDRVYTCDLTKAYVEINGDYRS